MEGEAQRPAVCSSTRLAPAAARDWAPPMRSECPETFPSIPAATARRWMMRRMALGVRRRVWTCPPRRFGGRPMEAVVGAIEIPANNLVQWHARYGDRSRAHQPFYDAHADEGARRQVEACLFRLYRDRDTGKAFEDLVEIVGRDYPLIAYLLFLRDRSRFLPIAPPDLRPVLQLPGHRLLGEPQVLLDQLPGVQRHPWGAAGPAVRTAGL